MTRWQAIRAIVRGEQLYSKRNMYYAYQEGYRDGRDAEVFSNDIQEVAIDIRLRKLQRSAKNIVATQ